MINRITEIQSAQEDFKTLHQSVEAAKASMPSEDELRKAIQRKENERASLNTRTVKARDKAQACAASKQQCFTWALDCETSSWW